MPPFSSNTIAFLQGTAFLSLLVLALTGGTSRAWAVAPTPSTATPRVHESVPLAMWTPVGKTWELTITFLDGEKAGQSETSLMQFFANGGLSASFPGSSLPATSQGSWHFVGPNVFQYAFLEDLGSVSIQAYVVASLTSATTYAGAGVGVATFTDASQQSTLSQTLAVAQGS